MSLITLALPFQPKQQPFVPETLELAALFISLRHRVSARSIRDGTRDNRGDSAKVLLGDPIHPSQIAIINEAFTPTKSEFDRAQEIVDAFAASGNTGVINLNGRMLDRPHLRLAERIIDQVKLRN